MILVEIFFGFKSIVLCSAGCYESIEILLEHGAEIDKTDVKSQTPLFIAMVNQHWKCGTLLLEKGADPNGHEKNLCTPLAIMAQRGYYEGIRILCRYGADTEDVLSISALLESKAAMSPLKRPADKSFIVTLKNYVDGLYGPMITSKSPIHFIQCLSRTFRS